MLKTQLYPTRSLVGRPIPIVSISVTKKSAAVRDHVPIFTGIRQTRAEIQNDPHYRDLIPEQISFETARSTMADGMASYPPPRDIPFSDEAPHAFVFGIGAPVQDDLSRSFWLDLEIILDRSGLGPVGGLCYSGFPYTPYYVTALGLNSANFALPREFRLSAEGGASSGGFLDGEVFETRQIPVAHSGVHIFPFGPIATDRLILRLADFPRLIRDVRRGQENTIELEERWGFALPFLYAFEHREGTRYRPRVPAGIVAATQTPPNYRQTVLPTAAQDQIQEFVGVSADWHVQLSANGLSSYFVNSAASLTAASRRFAPAPGVEFVECFGSGLLREGSRLTLVIEQAEEHARCIAGLRATFPAWATASGVSILVDVEIYEVDPLDGVSPIRPDPDLAKDKYSCLLFAQRNVRPSNKGLSCTFSRPSNARYFAIVFTRTTDDVGRLVLQKLELVQSAHVSISPRRSRALHVSKVNFRLIGPDLAEDFATLGPGCFSFSLEHLLAGQRRSILFSANGLLDLLSQPGMQLHQNHRFRDTLVEISNERAVTQKGGFDHVISATRTDGWRRSETGKDVTWEASLVAQDWPIESSPPLARDAGFRAFGNAEARQHTELLGVEGRADEGWKIQQGLNWLLSGTGISIPLPDSGRLTEGDHLGLSWADRIWDGIGIFETEINGLVNVSLSPWWLSEEAWEVVSGTFTDPDFLTQERFMQVASALTPAMYLNGATVGVGCSIPYTPLNYSVSTGQAFPTVTRNLSTGSSGSIAQQANSTGYSYAQHANQAFDESASYTRYEGGELSRTITRSVDREASEIVRSRGVEVYWQGEPADVVTGSIPVDLSFAAGAGPIYRTMDEALRVRLPNGLPDGLSFDVWFDVVEEVLRDDY